MTTDIVLVSLEPWDQVWRRNQHLADGLLRADPALRILFVEPDLDPVHDLRHRRRPRRGQGLRPTPTDDHAGRLWLTSATKWLPRRLWKDYDTHWAHAIVRAAGRLGMTNPVLWANDSRAAAIRHRVTWRTLYDITDDWLAAERPSPEQQRLRDNERLLLERAEEVVVCSSELARRKQRERGVHLIPNGVDAEAFRHPHPRPADLPPGPCAVYLGTLHRDRLDVDLCVATARALGGSANLVLVGPDALPSDDRARLRRNGVHLLGARPHGDVPGYLQHAEVLVVPHVRTAFTASLDPIKRYEYAAARRPAVVTPAVGFSDGFDGVRVVEPDRFPGVVRDLLRSPQPHLATPADLPTWADRVAAFQRLLSG